MTSPLLCPPGRALPGVARAVLAVLTFAAFAATAFAQPPAGEVERAKLAHPPVQKDAKAKHGGGEANLILPDLNSAKFLNDSVGGKDLLYVGLVVSVVGLLFGLLVYTQLKNLPVHQSMKDVSELIYETCKTYLFTQG